MKIFVIFYLLLAVCLIPYAPAASVVLVVLLGGIATALKK